jgi:hypothetical protein
MPQLSTEIKIPCFPGEGPTAGRSSILLEYTPGESLIFTIPNAETLYESLGRALAIAHQVDGE